ncbi:hypothetical protein VNO77_19030 [Canavalia gladiata]|uniref:Uncharacterized protein n=1 Tax=Canavalia gladiata TaxID=3824 RepID=A0AAN9QKZ6_CANGL
MSSSSTSNASSPNSSENKLASTSLLYSPNFRVEIKTKNCIDRLQIRIQEWKALITYPSRGRRHSVPFKVISNATSVGSHEHIKYGYHFNLLEHSGFIDIVYPYMCSVFGPYLHWFLFIRRDTFPIACNIDMIVKLYGSYLVVVYNITSYMNCLYNYMISNVTVHQSTSCRALFIWHCMMVEFAKYMADFLIGNGKKDIIVLSNLDFGKW